MTGDILGPILILDTVQDDEMHLAALFVVPSGAQVPPVEVEGRTVAPVRIKPLDGCAVWRARFTVPATRASGYRWDGTDYALASDLTGDFGLGFASCNGEEHNDLRRDPVERNAMWARLADRHRELPLSIMLHGGDQVYADEATQGHRLSEGWPEELPQDPSRADLEDLKRHLRAGFAERYIALWRSQEYAWFAARVPSMAQWDDHDICDGWGSLPRRATYSPVGQALFEVAREMALVFQHGTTDGDLAPRFFDRAGLHLGWHVEAPGLRIMAPDLRSERTRRQVMGQGGWHMVDSLARRAAPQRVLLVSSVPLLGPRLSIVEALMVLTPRMQKYEDDLRDQWQSRAHRDEWRRMLETVCGMMRAHGTDVTALSGEIHLATRATMEVARGRVMHQLVASGIAHRAPPRLYARTLGALATLGENPLPGHPIRIRRLPGQRTRYVAQRNALVLRREGVHWYAQWELEDAGLTPRLPI